MDWIHLFHQSLQLVVVMAVQKTLLEELAALVVAQVVVKRVVQEIRPQLHHLKEIMAAQMQAVGRVLAEAERVQLAVIVAELLVVLVVLVQHQVLLEHLSLTLVVGAVVQELVELVVWVALVEGAQDLLV
jgi:hypothetical protein